MDENRASRRWFNEDSIAKAYEKNAGVPAASYAGDAKEHAERVVALYEPENVDLSHWAQVRRIYSMHE